MGMFFNDNNNEAKKIETVSSSPGFLTGAGLMILGFAIALLTWTLKPLFGWLFDFTIADKKLIKIKVGLILVIFVGGPLLIYKIPFVQDTLTLSNSHTINIGESYTTKAFPSREHFVQVSQRKMFTIPEIDRENVYMSYAGYSDSPEVLLTSMCQLVTRSKKIHVYLPPNIVRAEGFEDKVTYSVQRGLYELSLPRMFGKILTNPLLFFSRERRQDAIFSVTETNSWFQLSYDLSRGKVTKYISSDDKVEISAKARSDEHAILCTGK